MIDDADFIGFAVIELAWSNNSGHFRSWAQVILQADALLVEGLLGHVVAQFRGQCVVGLSHTSLEQLDAVLLTNDCLDHVAFTRLELQYAC